MNARWFLQKKINIYSTILIIMVSNLHLIAKFVIILSLAQKLGPNTVQNVNQETRIMVSQYKKYYLKNRHI